LIAASLGVWAVINKQSKPLVAQAAVLDLRNRSLSREGESHPIQPPLEIARKASRVVVYLPFGSSDGPYELAISARDGDAVFAGNGTAKLKDGLTSMSVKINLDAARPGLYVIKLRKAGTQWTSYSLSVK
jgi:hypothetical protein